MVSHGVYAPVILKKEIQLAEIAPPGQLSFQPGKTYWFFCKFCVFSAYMFRIVEF